MKAKLSTSTKVQVTTPGSPPNNVEWVRDIHINARTRKQLIEGFWQRKRGISGQVAYVVNESDRTRLHKEGKLRIQIRDPSAQTITIIVPEKMLEHAKYT